MDEHQIIPYIEPIFRFCAKRLSDRHDAEDLASEILLHVLEGMKKYKIESLEAWVFRIAHNRYARFIDGKNKCPTVFSFEDGAFDIADSAETEEDAAERYEEVFRYLHTLSSEYKNLFVDHYLGELSVRALSQKYSLPETTVKWRLNVGRQKIRDRIGENKMDKVYQRINWNTTGCNGNLDTNAYLHRQISRAICLAAYERPLTVEEISMATGIPTMYIEDELPRLIYGDAIEKHGNKYATDFIIFRLQDRKQAEGISLPIVRMLADRLEKVFCEAKDKIFSINFYGNGFGMERLGHFIVPYLLRKKIRDVKSGRLHLENGPYPPRKDGGYGWFIVEETTDENENPADYGAGCNTAENKVFPAHIYYYWMFKYINNRVYHHKGTRFLCEKGIPWCADGTIPQGILSEEDIAHLIGSNLALKAEDGYKVNFACFTEQQFLDFAALFDIGDADTEDLLADWILSARKSFEAFVPLRLHGQINQWLNVYTNQIVGYVTAELIARGVLRTPDPEKPLTDCVFYVEGKYINP